MTSSFGAVDDLCINTIRTLSIDGVEKAASGHPGLPMGAAQGSLVPALLADGSLSPLLLLLLDALGVSQRQLRGPVGQDATYESKNPHGE